jgi:hypothetical protein
MFPGLLILTAFLGSNNFGAVVIPCAALIVAMLLYRQITPKPGALPADSVLCQKRKKKLLLSSTAGTRPTLADDWTQHVETAEEVAIHVVPSAPSQRCAVCNEWCVLDSLL